MFSNNYYSLRLFFTKIKNELCSCVSIEWGWGGVDLINELLHKSEGGGADKAFRCTVVSWTLLSIHEIKHTVTLSKEKTVNIKSFIV